MQHLIKLDRAIDVHVDNLVTLTEWFEQSSQLLSSRAPIGIIINENESVIEADLDLTKLSLIAFNFSKFADGRAFSEARILRDSLNFQGDIRAMGDFLPDQVAFLTRCGFSSFSCRSEDDKAIALNISGLVSSKYQSDTLDRAPLFRRR